MEAIDQIVSTIISQPIAEEYATGLFAKAIQANDLSEHLEHMSLDEAAESIEALETTPPSVRTTELAIQSQAAQKRLSIQGILTDSSLYLPPKLLPHIGQIEFELVNGAIRTYIDQYPDVVNTLISTAREMLDPNLMDAEHYASTAIDDGTDAKNREIVGDYLLQCVQDCVLEELDEALERAARNS